MPGSSAPPAPWPADVYRSPLFAGVSAHGVDDLLACAQPHKASARKGHPLCAEGEPQPGVGLLVEGTAQVVRETANGARSVLGSLAPGDLFGEMTAFSEDPRWPATVEATSNARAILLAPRFLAEPCAQRCLAEHGVLLANLLHIVSGRALALNRKVDYLLLRGMRERLAAYLLDAMKRAGRPTFQLPMNRDALADYLHVSRPSMSRELGRMRDEGLLEFYRSSVRILDVERLREARRNPAP